MERVGLIFLDRPSLREQVELVRYAEQRGFESAWVCETRLVRDAMTPLAAFAQATSRIRLATGVVNNWTRTTGLMAMTLATLHELSGGRVALGIGAYWDPLARNQGIRRRKHLAAMREYVTVVRRLLAMETVNLDGEIVKVQDLRLDLGDGASREPSTFPFTSAPPAQGCWNWPGRSATASSTTSSPQSVTCVTPWSESKGGRCGPAGQWKTSICPRCWLWPCPMTRRQREMSRATT